MLGLHQQAVITNGSWRAGLVGRLSMSRFKAVSSSAPFLAPSDEDDLQDAPIYLDFQATTPIEPRVLAKVIESFDPKYGNPHSRSHCFGWNAEKLVETARKEVASLINAQPKEIIFTSGATESNNLALKGVAQYYGPERGKKHLITVQTEHKCVLASAQYLEHYCGWDVTYLPVNSDGLVNPKDVEKAIRPDTALVSVMYVNNEIGVIQEIKEIAKVTRKHGVLMHVDAAQAVGKIPVDVEDLGIDLMSISAHKMYGPKGVGALYVRSKPRVRLVPQMHGGGQERGLRSGTVPAPIVAGFGEAARIARVEMGANYAHICDIAAKFVKKITDNIPEVKLNGDAKHRFPGNCNLSFDGVEGESLIMAMSDVAVSSGSACTSASLEPSYVLRALGMDEALAHTSLRFGIGKDTTEAEVMKVADSLIAAVKKLRAMSPLWDAKISGTHEKMKWT